MVGLLLSRVGTGRVLILASEKLRLGSVLLKSSPCLSVLRLPEQIDQGRCASAMGRVSQWTRRQLRTGRNGDDGQEWCWSEEGSSLSWQMRATGVKDRVPSEPSSVELKVQRRVQTPDGGSEMPSTKGCKERGPVFHKERVEPFARVRRGTNFIFYARFLVNPKVNNVASHQQEKTSSSSQLLDRDRDGPGCGRTWFSAVPGSWGKKGGRRQ